MCDLKKNCYCDTHAPIVVKFYMINHAERSFNEGF